MEILPVIIIISFTLWTILQEGKVATILQGAFMLSFAAWVGQLLFSQGLAASFPTLSISFLLLAAYGYIIQRVFTSTPIRLILAMAAVSPYLYGYRAVQDTIEATIKPAATVDRANELIIKCKHDRIADVKADLAKLDYIQAISTWQVDNAEITELDDYLMLNIIDDKYDYRLVRKLEQIPGVIWIEENEEWLAAAATDVPQEISSTIETASVNDARIAEQWAYQFLKMDEFHTLIRESGIQPQKPAKLFIVDSGVNFKHEDLIGNTLSHNSVDRSTNEEDANGHGTHCAGVAAAVTNNGKGIASFNPGPEFVQVGSVAAMNRFGFASQARITEALIEAADAGADVINMSFGGLSNQLKEELYDDVFEYLTSKNVIAIAAAGNSAADAADYLPSGRNDVITVAAISKSNERAQFSNRVSNTNFAISAPGTSILSTYKNSYRALDGTSMAAPHVAGLVAVLKSINPRLTTKQAHEILDKTGTVSKDGIQTGKVISPKAALLAIMD